ncbi:uncharacterized protein SPPG_09402 [Spizellomyces punctatus DAOM BR117]|uniref:MIT domain-containing protein n=1 Tax=Spizellomyces punctatus (strain DAOM BR117) TaxID=645134 RepID=A0A0L0HA30_SPIPD|nr:uncharacterized protein SPPG_09402 [Spizellomyces punctatus DAOM BR117]KNC97754.1 hypothetical protein SPPG_09402 [Spizellomyces punctatus DAOM BR117]|eukprot:XP_016605794.1 hypothetical protein SPPG_09402 [Spizellomyces punctatus DAOM BR117]
MDDGPVNKANAFASAAEDFAERGQYANAVEAHFRAAEQFLSAVSYTADPEAIKTLKLLYANHTRQGKELQRRLQTRSPSASPRTAPHHQQQQQQQHPVTSRTTTKTTRQRPTSLPPPNAQPTWSPHPHPQFSRPGSYASQRTPSNESPSSGFPETMEYGSRHYFLGQSQSDSGMMMHSHRATNGVYGGGGNVITHATSSQGPATMPVTSLDESEHYSPDAMDSVAQSYSVVGEKAGDDPEDPFNKFWEAVENLVDKISLTGPVAFATAPLGNVQGQEQPAVSSLAGYPDASRDPQNRDLADTLRSTTMLNSYFVVPPTGEGMATSRSFSSHTSASASGGMSTQYGRPVFYHGGVVVTEADNNMHPVSASIESNYFGAAGNRMSSVHSMNDYGRGGGSGVGRVASPILGSTSGSVMSREYGGVRFDRGPMKNKTQEELLMENEQLKHTIDLLTRKLAVLERAAEENNLLRSSIIQFRQDVQKQAKRFMHSQTQSRFGSLLHGHGFGRGTGVGHDDSTALAHRVAELEEELKRVREDSEKQSTAMQKYKERWDKLKESAKRKKEAASSTTTTTNAAPTPTTDTKPTPSPSPQLSRLPDRPHYQPPPPPSSTSSDSPVPPSPPTHFSTTPPTTINVAKGLGLAAAALVPTAARGVTHNTRRASLTKTPPAEPISPKSPSRSNAPPQPVQQQVHSQHGQLLSPGGASVSASHGTAASMFYSATSGFGFE